MRLIFRPRTRVRDRSPSRVGFASGGGASTAVIFALVGCAKMGFVSAFAAGWREGVAFAPALTITVSLGSADAPSSALAAAFAGGVVSREVFVVAAACERTSITSR